MKKDSYVLKKYAQIKKELHDIRGQAYFNKEGVMNIIDKIYQDGFSDGINSNNGDDEE